MPSNSAVKHTAQCPAVDDSGMDAEIKDRRRLQNDGRKNRARRTHEQSTDTHKDPARSSEVRRPLPRAIENQQLVFGQKRFGHDRTQTTRSKEPSERRNEVNEQDNHVAHRAISSHHSQDDNT